METWQKGFAYCWLMLDIKSDTYFSLHCLFVTFCLLNVKVLKGKYSRSNSKIACGFFTSCPLILYDFEQNLISRRTLNEMKLASNILKIFAQNGNCGYQVAES
jgi:hypothetical protein